MEITVLSTAVTGDPRHRVQLEQELTKVAEEHRRWCDFETVHAAQTERFHKSFNSIDKLE